MKKKIFLKILIMIVTLVLLIKFITTIFVEPWLGKKIQAELNEEMRGYIIEIDNVNILIIKSGIKLEGITIYSRQKHGDAHDLNAEIESIEFIGINLAKAVFKHDTYIRTMTISNSSAKGNIPFSGQAILPIVSPLNIRIGKILFDKISLTMGNTSNAKSFSLKEGVLKVYHFYFEKQDTISSNIVKQFDFTAEELISVSSDSMYSFLANGIIYSAASNVLTVNSFYIHPNYADYDFTSRYEFQTVRIEAGFSDIFIHDFSAPDYFYSGNLLSSWIEIGKMDLKVFRDKRKEFRHINKPAFQDMIYNYPGTIQIDSIGLINGDFTYTAHAEKANDPGNITFNEINARIYKITNDKIYKTKNASLELKGNALLMGKGKMTIFLKGKIFDSDNTFFLNGTLSDMEANELNPILEKNAFVYATSGKIDKMNFSFTANNTKAIGKMTMLYHGLDIAVKNNRTDDTTAFRERIISIIANRRVLDSNPIADEEVREGIIDNDRDPERFFFNYCFKSILSGIKSSIAKNPQKRKNS
jgi:hypothetical protein